MMNRKGFTLIELLAVIVILSTISVVAVSSLTKSLNDRDLRECREQISLAKNAAKIYFSLNDGVSEVCVKTLIDGDYFSGDKKTDKLVYTTTDTSSCNGKIYLDKDSSIPRYVYHLYDDDDTVEEEKKLKTVCNLG